MKIVFTLTADDWVEARRSRDRKTLAIRPLDSDTRRQRLLTRIAVGTLTIGIVLLFACSLYAGIKGPHFFLWGAGISGVFLIIVLESMFQHLTRAGVVKNFESDELNAGPYSIENHEGGLIFAAPSWSTEIEWQAVTCVTQTKNLILITEDTPRRMTVPKRAFASLEDQQRFVDAVTAGLHSSFSR